MLFERGPVIESVFARDHELRVGEHDRRFVGELGLYSGASVGFAALECGEQFFGKLALLVQIRARGKRSAR
jgi:hypothetical protein